MEIPCTTDKEDIEEIRSNSILYQSTDLSSVYLIETNHAFKSNSEMRINKPIDNLSSHVPGPLGISSTPKLDGMEHLEIPNVNTSPEYKISVPGIPNISSYYTATMNEIGTPSASKLQNTSKNVMASFIASNHVNNTPPKLSVSREHLAAAKELEKTKLAPQKCPNHDKCSCSEVIYQQGEYKELDLIIDTGDSDSDSFRICELEKKNRAQFGRLSISHSCMEESGNTDSETNLSVRSVKAGSYDLTSTSNMIPRKLTLNNSLLTAVYKRQNMANFGTWSKEGKKTNFQEKKVGTSSISGISDFFVRFHEANNFASFRRNNSRVSSSGNLSLSLPRYLTIGDYSVELKEESTNYYGLLHGILRSIPDNYRRESLITRIKQIASKGILPPSPSYPGTSIFSDSLYWERFLRHETARRRSNKKLKRKWSKQTVANIIKLMEIVTSVMDKKSYYTVFWFNNGRTNPRKELILSLIWTTMFLCVHKSYLDWGTKFLGFTVDPWFSLSFIQYFGTALGFLLYMQAKASSARWWEGRVQWQMIIDNSKRLAVLLNTHLHCPRLSRYGTRMIMAYLICVRNCLQDKYDVVWQDELLKVLDWKTVNKIMNQPRRLRYLAVLYGFQRIIWMCIDNKILPCDIIRDINPTIVTMSNSLGACNRIRITKLPWIIAAHLQFMLFVFVGVLPMSLVVVQKNSKWQFVSIMKIGWVEMYIYVIIVAYALFGLCRMALDIDNPFSFTRENHSFGFWGFYEYWSIIELDNLRAIFGFHVKHNGKLVSTEGAYGDTWTTNKLEIPLERVINSSFPRTHNLFGRTENVRRCLQGNKRSINSFSNGLLQDDDSTSFTFESASENEDGEFILQQTSVDKSMFHDGVFGNNFEEYLKGHSTKSVLRYFEKYFGSL